MIKEDYMFYDMHLYYNMACCALYYVIIKETQKREEYITRRIYIYIYGRLVSTMKVYAPLFMCVHVFLKRRYI